VVDETGQIQREQRVRTNAKALREVFGAMPRSRIALGCAKHTFYSWSHASSSRRDASDSGCQNEAPAERLSADGQWKYVSFDRNCGATTGSNFQISILAASQSLPSGAANAFIADDNRGETRFVAPPECLSGHKLRTAYSPKARIFKKEARVGPIEIE